MQRFRVDIKIRFHPPQEKTISVNFGKNKSHETFLALRKRWKSLNLKASRENKVSQQKRSQMLCYLISFNIRIEIQWQQMFIESDL